MSSRTVFLLLMLVPVAAFAGYDDYRAQYETRLQLPSLPAACDVMIDSPAALSRINDSAARVFCIRPGDYTGAGAISLNASGSSGAERWLIYYNPADDGKHPVRQSSSQRAILKQVIINGSHWILHRLTITGSAGENFIKGGWNVLDNLLVENTAKRAVDISGNANNNTIQNSVIRNTRKVAHADNPCIAMGGAKSLHIINNELSNCTDGVVASQGPLGTGGLVVENNDIYLTSAYYSGDRACAENGVDIKQGGTASAIDRIIHNRIWGWRRTDTGCGGDGSDGEAINVHENGYPSDYVLVENNIIMDTAWGIASPNTGSDHVSIIGNLLYRIQDPTRTDEAAFSIGKATQWELYLNTVIDSNALLAGSGRNNDIRCNAYLNSGRNLGPWDDSTQAADNAFYNSSTFGARAVVYGSAGDAQSSQFCFRRKRLTGPEQVCIPNVIPAGVSPHVNGCGADLGSRSGMGINNERFGQ